MSRIEKLVLCGVLTALAAIFSYVEVLIPFHFGVPGIKLGLANLVIVFALYLIQALWAFFISITRVMIVSALFANLSMAMYSLAGALLSLAGMALLKRAGCFSLVGVSTAGGVLHNIGQLTVAVLAVDTIGLLAYLPVLIAAGTATGFLIGIIAAKTIPKLPKLRS